MIRRPPRPTLFPYPTLSRSRQIVGARSRLGLVQPHDVPKGKKQTRKQNNRQEQANDVTAFEYALTDAPFSCIAHCLFLRSSQRSEEHTSELQSRLHLVCRLL